MSNLGDNNIMVILDNHISKPGWCCSQFDGNGFFGDLYFNPDLWLTGLTKMATMFNTTTNVVAMSLRNELRGRRENVSDWYRYESTFITINWNSDSINVLKLRLSTPPGR